MLKIIECRLCGSQSVFAFKTNLLKYSVSFYHCNKCKYIQSEYPFWIKEAYEESISILDTGILSRNLVLLKKVIVLLSSIENDYNGIMSKFFRISPFINKVLDYGGGYGILTRLLRDIGVDAYWLDKYSKNIFSKGFEWIKDESPLVMTSFELWEHFENPKQELDIILKKYSPGIYIFSTLLYGENIPSLDWWYYTFETGQHIGFYNELTINYIAKIYGYKYLKLDDSNHLFTKLEIDLHRIKVNYIRNKWLYFISKIQYKSKSFEDHIYLKKIIKNSFDNFNSNEMSI